VLKSAKGQPALVEQAVMALKDAMCDRLIAVVLYGSRARGEASMESDWDLLVIAMDLPVRSLPRHWYLKRLLPVSCRSSVTMLAKTPEEFDEHYSSLYLDIALDGQVIYDPQGFIATRLDVLRRRISQAGLKRIHTSGGFVWQWEKKPSPKWFREFHL
jgi:predicted nucleotidyltransferase